LGLDPDLTDTTGDFCALVDQRRDDEASCHAAIPGFDMNPKDYPQGRKLPVSPL
jgi:hypothetical protein